MEKLHVFMATEGWMLRALRDQWTTGQRDTVVFCEQRAYSPVESGGPWNWT